MTEDATPAGARAGARAGAHAAMVPRRRGWPDRHPWYLFSRFAVRAFLRSVADVEVSGMEALPAGHRRRPHPGLQPPQRDGHPPRPAPGAPAR